jgi:hypothetical protein
MERSDYLINLRIVIIIIILYNVIKLAFTFSIDVMDLLCEFFNIQYMYQSSATTGTQSKSATTVTPLMPMHSNYWSADFASPQQLLVNTAKLIHSN